MSSSRMEMELESYQFEPEWSDDELEQCMDEGEGKNVAEPVAELNQEDDRLAGIQSWCQCDFCSVMPAVKECLCCMEDSANLVDKLYLEYIECITKHSDFETICLNKAVLEVLMCCLRDVCGYGGQLDWNTRSVLIWLWMHENSV